MAKSIEKNLESGTTGTRNASGLNDRLQPKALLTEGACKKITKEEFISIVEQNVIYKECKALQVLKKRLTDDGLKDDVLTEAGARSFSKIFNREINSEKMIYENMQENFYDVFFHSKFVVEIMPFLEKLADQYEGQVLSHCFHWFGYHMDMQNFTLEMLPLYEKMLECTAVKQENPDAIPWGNPTDNGFGSLRNALYYTNSRSLPIILKIADHISGPDFAAILERIHIKTLNDEIESLDRTNPGWERALDFKKIAEGIVGKYEYYKEKRWDKKIFIGLRGYLHD
jgi:hypothetical protein